MLFENTMVIRLPLSCGLFIVRVHDFVKGRNSIVQILTRVVVYSVASVNL